MEGSKSLYKDYKQGVASAILSAVLWGILPVYWKSLNPINSFVIILYRIVFVAIFAFVVCMIMNKWKKTWEPLKTKGVLRDFFISGILITMNWSMYIWAVTNNFIIQTCIGYYIEPLLVCIFGVVLFKEKITSLKKLAIFIAAIGVAVIIVNYKELPLIAIFLGITFALYAAAKRRYKIEAVTALLYETMLIAPFALVALIYLEVTGQGALSVATTTQLWMMPTMGIVTGVPLILFTMATNRVPLVTLGLIEYISPSLALILGIFLYGEPFDMIQFVSFVIIWIGLAIFTAGELKEGKELKVRGDNERA